MGMTQLPQIAHSLPALCERRAAYYQYKRKKFVYHILFNLCRHPALVMDMTQLDGDDSIRRQRLMANARAPTWLEDWQGTAARRRAVARRQ